MHRNNLHNKTRYQLLSGQGVPVRISRAFPDWLFPYGTVFSARHQSCPDAIFVRSIPGRSAHLDPTKIPPQDRDIHLAALQLYPDTNHFLILGAATAQQASTITRLLTRSRSDPYRDNKGSLPGELEESPGIQKHG
eukprot:1153391-Pelagomonas_calceolata.AAC.1